MSQTKSLARCAFGVCCGAVTGAALHGYPVAMLVVMVLGTFLIFILTMDQKR